MGDRRSRADLARPGDAFNWDAEVVTSDFRTDTLEISGNVRVTQGPMSIEAGAAKASDVRSENSRWTFENSVHIVTSEAELQSDSASAAVVGGQLARARAEGSPAQFEQRGGSADRQVRGRAGVIEYDFVAGIVKLTDNVWFSNGKDEFRGDVVIYNVRDERVQINPGGQGRVRGIIRPQRAPSATRAGPPPTATAAAARERRMSLLRVEGLAKKYRSRQVVKDLSLEVARGEVVGLLGPNGAGKTTAFYMIVGLVPTDAGRIVLDDQDVSRLPMHRRARLGLGYLPQEPSVFRKLSRATTTSSQSSKRVPDLDAERREAMLESLLDELHIGHIRDSLGQSLSGGERRRVEIARALAAEPQFMLLDEPFAGVDPISVLDIQRIIRHLSARNIGVLITDHNVRETLGICARAYIVSGGSVIAVGNCGRDPCQSGGP